MSNVSTELRLRDATAADIGALVALNREVQALHARLAPEVFKADTADDDVAALFAGRLAAPGHYFVLAETNSAVAGYVWFDIQHKPPTPFSHAVSRAFVHHISVRGDLQPHGIATALLDAVAARAREERVTQLALETWATNDAARRFFEARGFAAVRVAMAKAID